MYKTAVCTLVVVGLVEVNNSGV